MGEIFKNKPFYKDPSEKSSQFIFGVEKSPHNSFQIPQTAGGGDTPKIIPPMPSWAALTPNYIQADANLPKYLEYCTNPGQNPNIPRN